MQAITSAASRDAFIDFLCFCCSIFTVIQQKFQLQPEAQTNNVAQAGTYHQNNLTDIYLEAAARPIASYPSILNNHINYICTSSKNRGLRLNRGSGFRERKIFN